MQPIANEDVKDLVEYEKVRDQIRPRIIQEKRARRVSVGDNLTFLFENRDTVWLQIQEMIRTERIVAAHKIQDELDAYNALIPAPGELSATLFIEIPDLHKLDQEQVRQQVNRFQGLDKEGVWLEIGAHRLAARFETGHSKEEKMAAVHYLHFALDPEQRAALADEGLPVRLVVEHPACGGERAVGPETRRQLIADLAD